MNPCKLTLNCLFEKVWNEHWMKERFQKSGHAVEVKGNYDRHIKLAFGKRRLEEIGRQDIRKWHASLEKTPITANRSLEVLSTLFKKAIEDEEFLGVNPCTFTKPFREKKRKRCATQEEIQRIGQMLTKMRSKSPVASAFLFTLLFTGARPRSLEQAKHEDLVETNGFGILTFQGKSTAETGEEETVLFPPQIMEMIRDLPRRRDGLIFGINMPRRIWEEIRKEAGCPDLWARDLRRTFATVGMSNGVNMNVISELLNHKSVQTTKIYARLFDKARVKAAERIATRMTYILSGKKAAGE